MSFLANLFSKKSNLSDFSVKFSVESFCKVFDAVISICDKDSPIKTVRVDLTSNLCKFTYTNGFAIVLHKFQTNSSNIDEIEFLLDIERLSQFSDNLDLGFEKEITITNHNSKAIIKSQLQEVEVQLLSVDQSPSLDGFFANIEGYSFVKLSKSELISSFGAINTKVEKYGALKYKFSFDSVENRMNWEDLRTHKKGILLTEGIDNKAEIVLDIKRFQIILEHIGVENITLGIKSAEDPLLILGMDKIDFPKFALMGMRE